MDNDEKMVIYHAANNGDTITNRSLSHDENVSPNKRKHQAFLSDDSTIIAKKPRNLENDEKAKTASGTRQADLVEMIDSSYKAETDFQGGDGSTAIDTRRDDDRKSSSADQDLREDPSETRDGGGSERIVDTRRDYPKVSTNTDPREESTETRDVQGILQSTISRSDSLPSDRFGPLRSNREEGFAPNPRLRLLHQPQTTTVIGVYCYQYNSGFLGGMPASQLERAWWRPQYSYPTTASWQPLAPQYGGLCHQQQQPQPSSSSSRQRSMQDRVAEAGGIPATISAMQRFPEDADICEKGCAVLGNVAMDNERNRQAVLASHGDDVVRKSRERHSEARRLVIFANRALAVLSGKYEPFAKQSQTAIETMLSTDSTLCRNSLEDLSAYAQIDNRHRGFILANKGLSSIVASMKHYSSDARLQELCCQILESLCSSPSLNLKPYISDLGGVHVLLEPVMKAMQQFLDDSKLQQKLCALLVKLARSDLASRRAIASVGGAKLISDAMRRHPNDRGVKIYGEMGLSLFSESRHPHNVVATA